MELGGQAVTLRVTTVAPLLHRGLVRAATAAGLTVVSAHSPAHISLHMAGRNPREELNELWPELDIAVLPDAVLVTVRRAPDLATMIQLHGLLVGLVDGRTPAD